MPTNLDVPAGSDSAQHTFSFRDRFIRPQNAKLTGVSFQVQAISYVTLLRIIRPFIFSLVSRSPP